jgi:hypothetical protein
VQQNAAGVRGVPEISFLSPKTGGQGVETRMQRQLRDALVADLFLQLGSAATTKRGPPRGRFWIPACAGMTLAPRHGRAEGQSPFAEGLGVSPNPLFLFPHEWGIEGVDTT